MKLYIFTLFYLIHNASSFKQKDIKKMEFKKTFAKNSPTIDYPMDEYDFINYYSQMNIYPIKSNVIENYSKPLESKPLDEPKINIYDAITKKIFYEKLKENKVKIPTEIKSNTIFQSTKFWIPLLGLLYIFISYFLNYTNIPCCINLV